MTRSAGWLEGVLEVIPEPAFCLAEDFGLLHVNAAAREFLGMGEGEMKAVGAYLCTSGVEFEGVPVEEAIARIAGREAGGGVLKLQVRRNEEDCERLLFLRRVGGPGAVAWACSIEGALAREDLVQLRAKAREAAHALNNVVMTAVGNVSLARLRVGKESVAVKHLDAAERNLLQVREITRELQQVAKKELPKA